MKRLSIWLATVLVLAAAALATAAWSRWDRLHRPFQDYEGSRRLVIEPGLDARAILSRLEAEGVIEDAFWTRLYLGRYLDDPSLKAGEYLFSEPMSAVDVLDKLVRGEVLTHDVTVIEGLDIWETAAMLAAAGFGDERVFRELVESPALIADLDPMATNLEGYLFPDTYSFARGTPEDEIVATLVRTFRSRFERRVEPLLGPAIGPAIGASPWPSLRPSLGSSRWPGDERPTLREVVALASIVEKETSLDAERATVAGVYTHRLRRGMGLFADPTVIYALKLAGTWDGNIRRADLEIDSPYNTYRYAGLPPGPICSPGLASLRAAAEPADVPYLYFVSRNDGSHVFARTLAEHNRNVEIWQKRYWRERWARERAQKRDPS